MRKQIFLFKSMYFFSRKKFHEKKSQRIQEVFTKSSPNFGSEFSLVQYPLSLLKNAKGDFLKGG